MNLFFRRQIVRLWMELSELMHQTPSRHQIYTELLSRPPNSPDLQKIGNTLKYPGLDFEAAREKKHELYDMYMAQRDAMKDGE